MTDFNSFNNNRFDSINIANGHPEYIGSSIMVLITNSYSNSIFSENINIKHINNIF